MAGKIRQAIKYATAIAASLYISNHYPLIKLDSPRYQGTGHQSADLTLGLAKPTQLEAIVLEKLGFNDTKKNFRSSTIK